MNYKFYELYILSYKNKTYNHHNIIYNYLFYIYFIFILYNLYLNIII